MEIPKHAGNQGFHSKEQTGNVKSKYYYQSKKDKHRLTISQSMFKKSWNVNNNKFVLWQWHAHFAGHIQLGSFPNTTLILFNPVLPDTQLFHLHIMRKRKNLEPESPLRMQMTLDFGCSQPLQLMINAKHFSHRKVWKPTSYFSTPILFSTSGVELEPGNVIQKLPHKQIDNFSIYV